jgi:aspartyl/asparaginyl beta-hydroxylase
VFKVEFMRSARVFVAQSGGIIRPHRDYLEFKDGFTRLHLVIQTNPLAINGEGSIAYHMAQGSIWLLDARVVHWAANLSDTPRHHVVVDFPQDMEPDDCLQSGIASDHAIEWVERKAMPAEVKALLEHAASADSGEGVEKLLDIADRLYVRYDCGDLNPYDLVLPHLGSSALCVEHAVRRRLYFFGV